MALALVVGAVGLSIVPVATAGPGDCDEDFYIEGTSQTRELLSGTEKVGQSNVSALNDETLTVELLTNSAEMDVEIFEKSSGQCPRSTNVSGCDNPERLDTVPSGKSTDSMTCTLEADLINDREFYVVVTHVSGSTLDFSTESV